MWPHLIEFANKMRQKEIAELIQQYVAVPHQTADTPSDRPVPVTLGTCRVCQAEKPSTDFSKNQLTRYRGRSECRRCVEERQTRRPPTNERSVTQTALKPGGNLKSQYRDEAPDEPSDWADPPRRRPSLKPGKVPRTRKSKGGAGRKHAKVRPAVAKPATKNPRAPAREARDC